MADNLTIARPYARAAFDFAKSNEDLVNWQNFLDALSSLVENSRVVVSADVQTKEQLLQYITKILDGFLDKYRTNFIKILIENARLSFCKEIFLEYSNLLENSKNIKNAIVVSACKLSKEQLDKIKVKLEDRYKCTITLDTKIDETLIAGFIIKMGNEVIDASVRTKLDKLSNVLLS